MKKIINKIKNLPLFDKILIGLVVFAAIFFAYTFFRKSAYLTVTVKVGEDNISWERSSRAWFAQLFYKGMKEKDGLGGVNAEVLGVRSHDTTYSKKAVYLTTRLKVVYSRSSDQYTYKGLAVLVGAPIKMYLDSIYVEGLITNIEGMKDPRERENIIVEAQIKQESPTFPETSGVETYIADAIVAGQKTTDNEGNVMVEVLNKRVEVAKKITVTADGRVLVGVNPLRRDIYLTLKINAIKSNNRYYLFDDAPILIGEGIPLTTPFISVWPVVTKISPVN